MADAAAAIAREARIRALDAQITAEADEELRELLARTHKDDTFYRGNEYRYVDVAKNRVCQSVRQSLPIDIDSEEQNFDIS
jgi:hypothetical protein